MTQLEELNKAFARERLLISLWVGAKQVWNRMGELAISIAGVKTVLSFIVGNLVLGVRNSIGLSYSVLLYALDRRKFGRCKSCSNNFHCRSGNFKRWNDRGEVICLNVK